VIAAPEQGRTLWRVGYYADPLGFTPVAITPIRFPAPARVLGLCASQDKTADCPFCDATAKMIARQWNRRSDTGLA
jgi:hypothetical protein